MKSILFSAVLFSSLCSINAQQELFKYQAVARDNQGALIKNTNLDIRFTILEDTPQPVVQYVETHTVRTNDLGIFNTEVGGGSPVQGQFSNVRWSDADHVMKVEMDPTRTGNYLDMGEVPFLSVPYALHARTVEFKDDADADPANEIQTLSLAGDQLSISNGNSINLEMFHSYWERDSSDIKYTKGDVVCEHPLGTTTILTAPGLITAQSDTLQKLTAVTPESVILQAYPGSSLHGAELGRTHLSFYDNSNISPLKRFSVDTTELNFFKGNQLSSLRADGFFITNENGFQSVDLGPYPGNGSGYLNLSGRKDNISMIYLGENSQKNSGVIRLFHNDSLTARLGGLGNTGELRLFGSNGYSNVYAGMKAPLPWDGTFEREQGMISIINEMENDIAGIYGSTLGQGRMFVRDGSYSVYSQDDSLRTIIDETGFFLISSQQSTAVEAFKNSTWDRAGVLVTNGQNGNRNVYIGLDEAIADANTGFIGVANEDGDFKAALTGQGQMYATDLRLYHDPSGSDLLSLGGNPISGQSEILAYGPNGTLNFLVSSTGNYSNLGYMAVTDDLGRPKAGMFVDSTTFMGEIFADVKHFRMIHPVEEDKEIWYASLEGPEAAAYVRGSARLKDGEAFVPFPDHYTQVANPEDMTVLITPNDWDTYGIAVIRKTKTGFYVKELKRGDGNFSFDWEAKCKRKGFENYQVVKPRMKSTIK